MSKILKKEIPQIIVILAFFLLSVVGLLGYLYSTKQDLNQKKQYLDVAIQEAIKNGASKDTLISKFVESDTLK